MTFSKNLLENFFMDQSKISSGMEEMSDPKYQVGKVAFFSYEFQKISQTPSAHILDDIDPILSRCRKAVTPRLAEIQLHDTLRPLGI